jgi:5-methylthioribose kinase
MSLRSEFARDHPGFPLLSQDDPDGLREFLADRGWIRADEEIRSCNPAGEGNMNLTLRIETSRHRFVLKQSRPWVEKYDDIPAPWDRCLVERRFYDCVQNIPGVADRMPELLYADADARVLLLEDLSEARDLTSLYRGDSLSDAEIDALADYLQRLHDGTRQLPVLTELVNREMRSLNHEHIFVVPLESESGLDLESIAPGLSQAARSLQEHAAYREAVRETAERYLADGECLVHADYFPGSWLRTRDGLRVVDAEFAFPGDPEIDVGCALAHLALARQPLEVARELRERYEGGTRSPLDPMWLARYAGVEVMRRLIGVAQLPLPTAERSAPDFRIALLEAARVATVEGSVDALWQSR